MIKIPPYLKAGDTIGLVCPAGQMAIEKTAKCVETLKEWGFNVKVGKTVGSSFHYFSGDDDQRREDLQSMMDDKNVNAILCARGGYGTGRIVDDLNFKKFRKHPKWIIGFSDITVLHAALFSNFKIASLHASMAGAFNEGSNNEYIESLKNALLGAPANYINTVHPFNKAGKCSGRLVGGNLSIIAHLIGTRSDYNTRNKILFMEDVGEYIYNIDRMMYQLDKSGKLKKLNGLIIGGFTEIKDTTIPFGKTAEEVIHDIVMKYDYPICFDFPVSHSNKNVALKVGGRYELNVTDHLTSLTEIE